MRYRLSYFLFVNYFTPGIGSPKPHGLVRICMNEIKTYREKLNELKLQTLEERRKRYDMVKAYKIIKGVDRMDKAHKTR